MPRYIDANEFKREMEKYLPEDRELALKVLKSIKTADVRENVHAHWAYESMDGFSIEFPVCSNCGEDAIDYVESKFCSNCGAKMDERSEE